MYVENKLDTYIINLASRKDRKENISNEFRDKSEFNPLIIPGIENKIGALGLWFTIKQIIIENARNKEYIIICEDDHQFTKHYTQDILFKSIEFAQKCNTDILLGGVSWFKDALQISPELFWIDKFTGLQFTVIFRQFYQIILDTEPSHADAVDLQLSELTQSKLVIHPFISTQKEFGYSDVTEKNNCNPGFVESIFSNSQEKLSQLKKVKYFYNSL